MTASPANFSTVPPWRLDAAGDAVEEARHAAARDLRVLAASSSVEPTRSANSTVASFRSMAKF